MGQFQIQWVIRVLNHIFRSLGCHFRWLVWTCDLSACKSVRVYNINIVRCLMWYVIGTWAPRGFVEFKSYTVKASSYKACNGTGEWNTSICLYMTINTNDLEVIFHQWTTSPAKYFVSELVFSCITDKTLTSTGCSRRTKNRNHVPVVNKNTSLLWYFPQSPYNKTCIFGSGLHLMKEIYGKFTTGFTSITLIYSEKHMYTV